MLLLSFPNDQKLEKISQRRFPAAGTRCYVDQAAQLDLDLLEHQDLGSELQLKTTYLDFVKLQDCGGTSFYTFVLFYCTNKNSEYEKVTNSHIFCLLHNYDIRKQTKWLQIYQSQPTVMTF